MASSGATPRKYRLKVQSHSVRMVTSCLKMRTAKNLMVSFSGQLLETIVFYRDTSTLQKNFEALTFLVSVLHNPEINPDRTRNGSRTRWQGYLWKDISADRVINFLRAYRTHPDAYRVNGAILGEFI